MGHQRGTGLGEVGAYPAAIAEAVIKTEHQMIDISAEHERVAEMIANIADRPHEELVTNLPRDLNVTTEQAIEALHRVAERAYEECLFFGLEVERQRDELRAQGDAEADGFDLLVEGWKRQVDFWRERTHAIARARAVPVFRA